MSSKLFILAVAVLLLVGLFLRQGQKEGQIQIGILQTASHPALDQARAGFIEELTRLSPAKLHFRVQNAEGKLADAQSIAKSFHVHEEIRAVFAIGTPAVQAAVRFEREKPVIIAAVSDPESLNLPQNVCGTTDRVDSETQADLVLKIVPGAKVVAILYNPAEANSEVMRKKMVRSLELRGIEAICLGVHSEAEVKQAAISACKRSELLLIPTDNLMASCVEVIAKEAKRNGRPFIASDVTLISKGATAALGADYHELGRESARLAMRALFQNEPPSVIGIHDPKESSVVGGPS